MIDFKILGEPKGKGRPRFRSVGKFVQTYTDKETVNYETLVKLSFINSDCKPYSNEQLIVRIDAYFPIPKSTTKKNRALMLDDVIRHSKKPDADNLAKSILDGLNGVAFMDDNQIVDLRITKHYAENEPYVRVQIAQYGG